MLFDLKQLTNKQELPSNFLRKPQILMNNWKKRRVLYCCKIVEKHNNDSFSLIVITCGDGYYIA